MPDITMCTSKTCERRGQCYRSTAKPDKIQSYANFTSLCADRDFRCQWTITEKEVLDDKAVSQLMRC